MSNLTFPEVPLAGFDPSHIMAIKPGRADSVCRFGVLPNDGRMKRVAEAKLEFTLVELWILHVEGSYYLWSAQVPSSSWSSVFGAHYSI